MAVRKLEHELERLGELRDAPPEDARAALRKALKDPVNLMVAKAAGIAAARQFDDLIPDLLQTYNRLFTDPAKRDPKCWAKNAIAKALTELEHRESAPFLRGMRHVQMEAGWGPPVDTADILRGICVLGLVACLDLRREEVMRALVDAANDKADPVRVEAVRAIAQMDGEEAILVLRMKARAGDASAAVMGQVFDCLLALEGEGGLAFVASFLHSAATEVCQEALLSLGSSRLPGAVPILLEAWDTRALADLREIVVRAMSFTRCEEAFEFLLEIVQDGRMAEAAVAVQALSEYQELRPRLEEAARGREGLEPYLTPKR